jgi:hypothetical protein
VNNEPNQEQTMNKKLKAKFESACDALHSDGYSVVAVIARYTPDTAEFSTRITVHGLPKKGVTDDHVVLDSIREIAAEWSQLKHPRKK